MAKTLLRGIRVKSKEELKTRIEMYLREVNEEPVVLRCKDRPARLLPHVSRLLSLVSASHGCFPSIPGFASAA